MKNIHLIPTDKPSKLSDCHNNNLHLNDVRYLRNYQNIYITNSEEIKEGDFYLFFMDKTPDLLQCQDSSEADRCNGKIFSIGKASKKIILTTDQDLIKEGVQAIDDEFLEWFIKNLSCEEIEVFRDSKQSTDSNGFLYIEWLGYKIEIPKEEPKQALVDMMQDDEELGLYDEPRVEELIPYIGSFLLRNGFKGSGGDTYHNPKCTITVLEDCYQINFNYPECGEVSTYTDSHSIPHLVGVLTWNNLIDKNYEK